MTEVNKEINQRLCTCFYHVLGVDIVLRTASSLSNLPPPWVSLNQSLQSKKKLSPSSFVTSI